MFDEQLVAARDFVGSKWADGEVIENVLLVGSGLAMTGWFLFHCRQGKRSEVICPAQSVNPLPAKDLPPWKDAPYQTRFVPSDIKDCQVIDLVGARKHPPECIKRIKIVFLHQAVPMDESRLCGWMDRSELIQPFASDNVHPEDFPQQAKPASTG